MDGLSINNTVHLKPISKAGPFPATMQMGPQTAYCPILCTFLQRGPQTSGALIIRSWRLRAGSDEHINLLSFFSLQEKDSDPISLEECGGIDLTSVPWSLPIFCAVYPDSISDD